MDRRIFLNSITEEKEIPVFETPEFPEQERVAMLKKCHAVENEVIENTAIRMYKHTPMAEFIMRRFFNVHLFEALFFKNLVILRIFEWIHCNKLMKR